MPDPFYTERLGEATVELYLGDSLKGMKSIRPASVDAVITDPPYAIDMAAWDRGASLDTAQPAWAKHPDPRRRSNAAFQTFSGRWASEAHRVLRPGGFLLAFAAARTYHRMAVAVEDVGFDIRNMVEWFYGQGWARSAAELKPSHEPAVLGRKQGGAKFTVPKDGNRHPANVVLDDGVAAFLGERGGYFYAAKPSEAERGAQNDHPTVKPVELMRWLIRLWSPPGGLVVDPFVGSGTTAVACLLEGRSCIAFDSWDHALTIARDRIEETLDRNVSPITGEPV